MKPYLFTLILCYYCFFGKAQSIARIEITLENTTNINVPDPLVREYFIYFLIANYHSRLQKYYTDEVRNLAMEVKNQNIRQALTFYTE